MSFPAQAPQSTSRPPTAKEIWNGADETLRKIDQSFLVTQHQPRDFPQFTMNELTLGSLLGKGGFSDVSEVVNIQIPESVAVASLPVAPPKDDDDHANDPILIPRHSIDPQAQAQHEPLEDHHENDPDDHIDLSIARSFMSKYCLRQGSARYAIKRLKSDLSDIDRARGAVDLAIEIKFLSTLWHPNISTCLVLGQCGNTYRGAHLCSFNYEP